MQLVVNSQNIGTFIVIVKFDIYSRQVSFDTSQTTYVSSGNFNVKGISFSLQDQSGIELADGGINFTSPQITGPVTSANWIWNLDLSSVDFSFLFQAYKIIAAIQDQDGTIYQTVPIYKTLCQPQNITDSGYVPGMFQIIPDCVNSALTVKEITLLVYNNMKPSSVSKTGTLNYPTGTISPLTFSNTPISNNVVYTGQYNIQCTTIGTYSLGDDVYVLVSYITNNVFPVTCQNSISDLMCCIVKVQQTAIKHCEDEIGENAKQQLYDILPYMMTGIGKEISGQDASFEAGYIKKFLNCDCGSSSQSQSEFTPINPAVNSIVLNGIGGTAILPPTITGNTKTYNIASNIYQVAKGNTGDLAFTITVNTAIDNTVQYLITINYDIFAASILTAISNSPTLQNQLSALVNILGFNAQGLDGLCIIDLSKSNYSLSQTVNGATLITQIVINGTVYNAPSNLFANNAVPVSNWLNSLSLEIFSVTVASNITTILSIGNSNVISTMTFTSPNVTQQFQVTTATEKQIFQALFNYICNMTAARVALGTNLSICSFDYSGNVTTTTLLLTDNQGSFNAQASAAICTIVARMNSITGVTCAKIKACFLDDPSASFDYGTDRYLSIVAGACTTLTAKQQAMAFIAAVNADSDTKAAFCAIDCSVPGSCPEVSNINVAAVSQTSIGFYGVTWPSTPSANQIVTFRYRISGTTTWFVASNAISVFPNGNINGTSPFQQTGLTAGTIYDIWISNNCGGLGFVGQVTTPANTIYSGSFKLDTSAGTICGQPNTTLYSAAPFATGVALFTDPGLTTIVTGFTFVANSGGSIFNLNSSTGVVGADTGSNCSSGTPGTYILGNNIGTICSGSPVTLYTAGAFATGGTLFSDSALTIPVTGSTYVVNTSNNHIFNLNTSTGQIGSDTGTICSGTATLTLSFANAGGSFLSFSGALSNPVDANVSINQIFADGFNNGTCSGGAVASAQITATPIVITAGFTANSRAPESTSGSWVSATHNRITSANVNGSPVVNGTVITVGSYSVTLIIVACN